MKRASIVITSYNQPSLLPIAVASAIGQSWGNTQVIIADDNSSETSVRQYLEKMKSKADVVVFTSDVSDEDRGKTARYATQINHAVNQYADGDYLFFLPDDDCFHRRKVEEQVNQMIANNWDVSYGSQLLYNHLNVKIGERRAIDQLESAFNIVDHGQVCVTRRAFDSVGGWPDGPECWSGADAYFWNRLTAAGYLFNPVPNALCMKTYRDGVQAKVFSGRLPWS